jgi:oligopeptidase B
VASKVVESPNGNRTDPYYWLRDDARTKPEVIAYLNAENAWFERYSARYKRLEDKLFAEIKGRIKEDDASPPFRHRDYYYYTRYEEGREYPIYARKRGALTAAEEVMLDGNALAQGHEFFEIEDWAVSPGQHMLAWADDTAGRRQYVVHIKNLVTGEVYADQLTAASGSMAWAADDKTLFYVVNDPVTLRSYQVKRHVLGTDPATDVLVYEEKDESFYTHIGTTGSQRFIVIHVSSTVSDEARVLPIDRPAGRFRLFAKRRRDFHYFVDHITGRWIVRTDWDAPNYRLMQVADAAIGDRTRWQPLVPHNDKVFINGFALFRNYFVTDERSGGLRRLRVMRWDGGEPFYVASDETAYAASIDVNAEQDTETLRYSYTSLTTPTTIYDVNMRTGERTLVKRQPVLGDFDPTRYATERVWVDARDGARVPVSLVYRKGFQRDGAAPMLQYGYGAYGFSMDPVFRSSVLSLLDRGFVYAIAHIRGGEEMGRAWYESGKKLHKKNTFTDFIDVTEYLVKHKYAAVDKVFAQGGSAGGLLVAAVANMRPALYRGILAAVPFVDVVTSMLDESIPLTTNEFDEWGDPRRKKFYDYMLSYSPYDNVKAQAYPAMLVETGLHDSQVQYYEPAKWVAKLRATKTDKQPLVFKINMEAGHGGKSGRFRRVREVAQEYAFMLDLVGIKK